MITSRETLYAAIFDHISTTPGFASYWRRYRPISAFSDPDKPVLMMRQVHEKATSPGPLPNKYIILLELGIICVTPIDTIDAIPATTINTLISAVEDQFNPPMVNASPAGLGRDVLNLGIPTVSRIWIEGTIEIHEAFSDNTSLAFIPLNVVCS